MSKQNNINIAVEVDANKVPEKITWNSTDLDESRSAKAMLLSLWDSKEMNTMNIDLWTKDMSVEEMRSFVVQTLMTLADTYERATSDKDHATAVRGFTQEFAKRIGVLEG